MVTMEPEKRSPFVAKIIDSHLRVWASPQEAADKCPYFPGQEPTLPGHVDFLLECMGEAGVHGALIVQPINHKFDHSLVTSVLKKFPSKFVGCCLANPAEDGGRVKQLEDLVLMDGYRAVRFNSYLWPSGQQMTNEIGKGMFCRARELGVPVGFVTKMTNEIGKGMFCRARELGVPVGFMTKKLRNYAQNFPQRLYCLIIWLSANPQHKLSDTSMFSVYINSVPYSGCQESHFHEDLSQVLSELVSSFGANRVMWGSDFPYVVDECVYKESVTIIAKQVPLRSVELDWIMGKTIVQLFQRSTDFLSSAT